MKFILFIIISAFIILAPKIGLPICNIDTAKQAIPPRIFAEIAIDDNDQNVIFTRAIHNKTGIFLSEFSRCYFDVFDFNYLYKQLTILGLTGLLFASYRAIVLKRYNLILLILFLPLIPFFKQPEIIVMLVLKTLAISGVLAFMFLK